MSAPTRTDLDALAAAANAEHHAYQTTQAAALEHAMAAGDALIEAKELVGHGRWLRWVAEHCDFTDRTASNYMRLARNRKAVTDMDGVGQALDALAEAVDPRPEVEFVVVRGRPFGSDLERDTRRFGIPERDDRLATFHQRDPVKGLFAWMGPWRATCPCCGTYEVHPRSIHELEG
jgi:Protein of unknown function (DUF3102)